MRTILLLVIFPVFIPTFTHAQIEPDWSVNATNNAGSGRANIYQWPEGVYQEKIKSGKLHAAQYPVETTGLLMPAESTMKVLNAKPGEPIFGFLKAILSISDDFKDFRGFWDWLGLHDYPDDGGASIPYPNGVKPNYPVGVSLIERDGNKGFTIGCAACHSSDLFGKTILGLTNRFPRAQEFFIFGKKSVHLMPTGLYGLMTGASKADKTMYRTTRENLRYVGIKKPEALGLDTALAQVVLSLAHRAQDPWVTRNRSDADHPRATPLDHQVSDSKPAPWWNVKYKTRWLSDGSVMSGNPILTNFLWNEIGRGVDLVKLTEWIKNNSEIIQELTTAVFATQPPKFRDFFGESSINIERAKRGEELFLQNCAHCHGDYHKAWNLSAEEFANQRTTNPDLLALDTVGVKYSEQTKVMNVGTDAGRLEGMKALEEALNPLAVSKEFSIVIQHQNGYVPPPLDGIWSRYPYFHNNSIPNLCALMTKPTERPKVYYAGKALNKNTDFDQNCLGYPIGSKTPAAWKKDVDYRYDATHIGMSNSGHYERIFTNTDGTEKYTAAQKMELIEFLKTL